MLSHQTAKELLKSGTTIEIDPAMVLRKPVKDKTNRNAITVSVAPSPEARVVDDSHHLGEKDGNCENSEQYRPELQVDHPLAFTLSTSKCFLSNGYKMLPAIDKKASISEEKNHYTLIQCLESF